MADDERHLPDADDRPLELPSLMAAFRRRRRKQPPAEQLHDTQGEETSPLLTAPAEAIPRQRRRIHLHVPVALATALTGAVVGLALVGMTAGSLHLCSSMRGTSSCGKPGLVLLLAVTAIAILLGALLLRVAGVPSPGSTSILGVGLLVVLVLLALLGVLDEWWVVVVVPAIAVVTYLAAWWLTTTYADPGDRTR